MVVGESRWLQQCVDCWVTDAELNNTVSEMRRCAVSTANILCMSLQLSCSVVWRHCISTCNTAGQWLRRHVAYFCSGTGEQHMSWASAAVSLSSYQLGGGGGRRRSDGALTWWHLSCQIIKRRCFGLYELVMSPTVQCVRRHKSLKYATISRPIELLVTLNTWHRCRSFYVLWLTASSFIPTAVLRRRYLAHHSFYINSW